MLYTINTGLLTALCAIGVLISVSVLLFHSRIEHRSNCVKFAALPNDYVFLSFYFCLPKCEYVGSMYKLTLTTW